MAQEKFLWWQQDVIYQIYPRSFQDTNGDGIGDLKGIIQKLDYLSWLGIDVIWLSPVYPSPMKDFGYDISNYTDVHPVFGSMEDFELLVARIHALGMKLILDLVPNHTSDEHPWFIESRSSRDNAKRNWYIWVDPREDGSAPNNWLSVFGGDAWQWDEHTRQYYYHAFLKEQPDLNWRNPQVQQAMLNVMRFWLDKGVDGFRVDVMWHMIKDSQLRDNPPNPDYTELQPDYNKLLPVYSTDQPEVHDIVRLMRNLVDSYGKKVIIGEIYLPIEKLVVYYGVNNLGAHLPFNFQLLTLPWQATQIATAIDLYEGALPVNGWPNWVLGNHDQQRIASRVGMHQARVAAMLLLTLRGTPTIYYGEEISMMDVPIEKEQIQDPQGLNMPGKNLSRDPARTPMPWDASDFGGFSNATPWLPLGRNYKRVNVQVQQNDPYSMLSFYRKLIQIRKKEPALRIGNYRPVHSDHQLISYTREWEEEKFLVVLNLTHAVSYFDPPHVQINGTIVASTHNELEGMYVNGAIYLGGDEGILVKLNDISSL
ncbi:alpha-amylase [Niastella caeni]|uniref:Alpha-amylase n=1 Tax=Niastella caeni TaxID=2569763 RepID=A0A4S8HEY0_9BACT|nr:alpha-amylase family glycosyl hydrolase [Niastella caeni]THU32971.1 alpha-amylase [Niastella caeni]